MSYTSHWGKIGAGKEGSPLPAAASAGGQQAQAVMLLLKQQSWVQVSAPPLTCRIITGSFSASKYLICKTGTSIMVLSTTVAWARDKGQSA